MSVDPRVQSALEAPLRDGSHLIEAQFSFALDVAAEKGWPRPTLFGTALDRWVERRRIEREERR